MNTTLMYAPMSKGQAHQKQMAVETTTDYGRFKTIVGNREISDLHKERIKKSMQSAFLVSPIIVNEKWQVIDGQHRLQACVELKLPVNYIMVKGYGLKEVQILNAVSSNWKMEDFCNAYADSGYEEYIKVLKFVNEHSVSYSTACYILGSTRLHYGGKDVNSIKSGEFVCRDYLEACDTITKLRIIESYYDGAFRRAFIAAFMTIEQNANFNFSEFIAKLKQQPSALTDCVNQGQYMLLIEDIYNYRRRDKVNIRF